MFNAFILPGIGLGLTATSTPGPMQAYLLNITLRYGWRRGLFVVLSPLFLDIPLVTVVVFVLGQLPPEAIQVIRVVGGLLLLAIAYAAWGQYRKGVNFGPAQPDAAVQDASGRPLRILLTAMLINAFSPGPYLFWATVNGPLLISALEQSVLHGVAFVVAFYGTFLSSMAVLAYAFDRVGRIDPRITRFLLLLTVLILIIFGTGLIAEAFGVGEIQRYFAVGFIAAVIAAMSWRALAARRATSS